jgi:hypothetical protein
MINIDQLPLRKILMPIHVVLLQSLWLQSSPVANDGLWVKEEHATAKQWWALQQPLICEFRTWILLNIDQLHHLKISWHSYSRCVSSVTLTPLITSVANDGLWVKLEQATAKQWWTLLQAHICEFRTWIMIDIDQLHHWTHYLYPYMCFFGHFDSTPHQRQMMACGSNRNTKQQNSGGHCSNCIFVNSEH